MSRYCFTYDAKDSRIWNGDDLKIKIAKVLIEAGAENLISPTASTILFDDPNERTNIGTWNLAISENLSDDIFYYMCLVATVANNNIDRIESDLNLSIRFQLLLHDI